MRINLAYGFTPEALDLIKKASTFLVEIKSITSDIRPEAVLPQFTADILKARGLKAPVGAGEGAAGFGIRRELIASDRWTPRPDRKSVRGAVAAHCRECE